MKTSILLIIVFWLCSSWISVYIISDDFNIQYSAYTRGYSIYLEITKDSTHVKENNLHKNIRFEITVETNKNNYSQIVNQIIQIKLDEISSFKAPSNKYQGDGDLLTKMIIIKNGKRFNVPTFDYSNPNIKLKYLDSLLKNQIDIIKEMK